MRPRTAHNLVLWGGRCSSSPSKWTSQWTQLGDVLAQMHHILLCSLLSFNGSLLKHMPIVIARTILKKWIGKCRLETMKHGTVSPGLRIWERSTGGMKQGTVLPCHHRPTRISGKSGAQPSLTVSIDSSSPRLIKKGILK